MPEIKHTFQGGKMNKDLDERLVRNGEYRHAMNVQVRTTDDDSDGGAAGTVQNIKGNINVGSSYFQGWMNEVYTGDLGAYLTDGGTQLPKCVGTVTDEKNDKAYYFFACKPVYPDWATPLYNNSDRRIFIDTILEKDVNTNTAHRHVVVDKYAAINTYTNVLHENVDVTTDFASSWSMIHTKQLDDYRVGMEFRALNTQGENILLDANGDPTTLKIKAIDPQGFIMFHQSNSTDIIVNGGVWFVFEAPKVLKFHRGLESNDSANISFNHITGINIIDGLLFWTDNNSEPKKINIERCKAGTNVNGVSNNGETHTKLYIKNKADGTLVDAADVHNNLDSGDGIDDGSGVNSDLQEKHITVIRKSPKSPPTLHMKNVERPGTTNIEFSHVFVDLLNNQTLDELEEVVIQDNAFLVSQFKAGDLVVINELNSAIPNQINAVVLHYTDDTGVESENVTANLKIQVTTSTSVGTDNSEWAISIEQKDPLFELKLARFGYRYRYEDGEYSTFSPWSEIAFMPDKFEYTSHDAYNLGMVNTLRELIIKDFIPYNKPLDVVAVDILYKTTDSPSVYVVDTIEKNKSPEWELFTPDGEEDTLNINTVQLAITSEMIHNILESNQMLRAWDNVPRYALAQEVIGNRLVYGNYTQGYDINYPVNIIPTLESFSGVQLENPQKSLKSIRNYKIGVVYGDKYGRETPVITSRLSKGDISLEGYSATSSDVSIPKNLCAMANSFVVSQYWGDPNNVIDPPDWVDYVKYYIKEPSNEYYNLIMDYWYPAEHPNEFTGGVNTVWLSFNSADRNKVDEETYLLLKNRNGSNTPVLEKAKYKIIAIENEAPEFIKTSFVDIGDVNIGGGSANTAAINTGGVSGTGGGTVWEDYGEDPENNTPILLYTNKHMEFTDSCWNSNSVGYTYSGEGVFGREVDRVDMRVVGKSISGDIVTGEIKSSWKRLVNWQRKEDSNGVTTVKIMWDKKWEQGDVDMKLRFQQQIDAGNTANFSLSNLHYFFEFRESKVENRPEFDGRFFVKVQMDLTLSSQVANIGANYDYTGGNGYPLYYIDSQKTNQQEQGYMATGISGEIDDFSTWFGGNFNNFCEDCTDDPDLFATAGGLWYNPNGDGILAGPGCGPTNMPSAEINKPGWFAPVSGDIPDTGWVEPYGEESFANIDLSPFGSCNVRYNTMTKNYWKDFNPIGEVRKVFIDAVNMAVMKVESSGPSSGGAIDPFNGFSYSSGMPEDIINTSSDGRFRKPINSMGSGNAVFGGSTGPSDGTVGSIALSWVGHPNDIPPSLFTALSQENTLFRFSNDPNQEVYRTLGVIYKSPEPTVGGNGNCSNCQWNYIGNFEPSFAGFDYQVDLETGFASLQFGNSGESNEEPTGGSIWAPGFDGTMTWPDATFVGVLSGNTHYQFCCGCDNDDLPNLNEVKTYSHSNPTRQTMWVEFRKIDQQTNNMTTAGLDTTVFDPRGFMHHDGRDSVTVEIITPTSSAIGGINVDSEKGACFETEPKESADVELYYEASTAIPMRLNEDNVFDFIPINSEVSIKRKYGLSYYSLDNNEWPINKNVQVSNVGFAHQDKNAIITVRQRQAGNEFDQPELFVDEKGISINDKIFFEHKDGTKTSSIVNSIYEPINPSEEFSDDTIDPPFNFLSSNDTTYGIVSGPKAFKKSESFSQLVSIDPDDTSFIISDTNASLTSDFCQSLLGANVVAAYQLVQTDDTGNFFELDYTPENNGFPYGAIITSVSIYAPSGTTEGYYINFNKDLVSNVEWNDGFEIYLKIIFTTGYYGVSVNVWDQPVKLSWHNCWTFGNGVESDRIRDDFNAPQMDNGVKVSSTFSGYKEENISSGLIYSGLYNSMSEVNNLNEFNMAQKITKALNPSYGSIQALKTRDTDIVTLCEDKVLKVLANKDALFNADGNPQLTASDKVLGTAIPFIGDYGISKNPESLASDQYRLYFTDKQRGAVLRLSQDGLTPISDVGMRSYFRKNLKLTTSLLGTFDAVSGEYNLAMQYPHQFTSSSISFNEAAKGWSSFKSFVADSGLSLSGKYFTTKDNKIWEHHISSYEKNGDCNYDNCVERNSFYGTSMDSDNNPSTRSSIEILFNDSPSVIKSFKTVNYEGSQARINRFASSFRGEYTGNVTFDASGLAVGPIISWDTWSDGEFYNLVQKNGWYVHTMKTDSQQGSIPEFINKEGKWFNQIKGVTSTVNNIDTSEFTVQGLGQVSTVDVTYIASENLCYNDEGNMVDCCSGSCVSGNCLDETDSLCLEGGGFDGSFVFLYGCTDPVALNYNTTSNTDDGSCIYTEQVLCWDPANPNFMTPGLQCDEGTVVGCMDNGNMNFSPFPNTPAYNYNPNATVDGQYSGAVNEGGFPGTFTTASCPTANCSCLYPSLTTSCFDDYGVEIDCPNNCAGGQVQDGDGNCVDIVFGCSIIDDPNYNENANTPCSQVYATSTSDLTFSANVCIPNPAENSTSWNYTLNCECCESQASGSIVGCLDPNAANYLCQDGNGSWEYGVPCNDAVAIQGISSCVYLGCVDEFAADGQPHTNYDPLADFTCIDLNGDGIGDCCTTEWGVATVGCTDPNYLEYCENCVTACPEGSCIGPDNPNGWCNCCQNLIEPIEEFCDPNDPNAADNELCYGCLNPDADNYCSDCLYDTVFGGSTPYPCTGLPEDDPDILGCMDVSAFNYNNLATVDDGSCEDVVVGCTDSGSFNYNPSANTECDDCCVPWVYGCTDPLSANYNALAGTDDGSCYDWVYGCMDPLASNYNSAAMADEYQQWDYGINQDSVPSGGWVAAEGQCPEATCGCVYPEQGHITLNVENLQSDSENAEINTTTSNSPLTLPFGEDLDLGDDGIEDPS